MTYRQPCYYCYYLLFPSQQLVIDLTSQQTKLTYSVSCVKVAKETSKLSINILYVHFLIFF